MSTPPPPGPPPPFQQPYQQPGYQQPSGFPGSTPIGYQPYGASPPPLGKTNGMSIASLVLGIIGVLAWCSVLPALLALIFGIVGKNQIRRDNTRGRGLAIAGMVLGVIGLVAAIAFWVWWAAKVDCTTIDGDTKCTTN